ncbi:MAG: hypothetical protein ACOYOS_20850, partial [Syntrophales bacterium]
GDMVLKDDKQMVLCPRNIHTYLSSLEGKSYPDNMAEGLLLYPTNGYQVDLAWNIRGHTIRVKTLDLGLDWRNIRKSLLEITGASETGSQ